MMSNYVIAKRGMEFLDTPVFFAGSAGSEEAIAVFTDRSNAQRYIDQAGWASDHEVGELNDFQLLQWAVRAYEQGTQYIAMNPDYERQMESEQQEVIVIEEKLNTLAKSFASDLLREQHETQA